MTATAPPVGPSPRTLRTTRAVIDATWRATRSPWVWKPAALGTAGVATATVALARALTVPPQAAPPRPLWPLRISRSRPGFVRLVGPAAACAGRWGLEYLGGWGEVGPPVDGDGGERPFRVLAGDPPISGSRGRLDANLWPDRHTFSDVTGVDGYDTILDGETGPLPAWVFPAGDGRRWGILVHGRGAGRAQMLRLVPAFHARGVTTMLVSYRNDFPTCSDPTGRMSFGHREWRDVDAAATAALDAGARSLVMAGMSLGGGIIATLLRRSDVGSRVVGTVLDAPALNWGPILRHVARARRLPGWLVPGVMTATALHARIDWKALNHLAGHQRLSAPSLLIHGDDDPVVPVALSDAHAAAEPDLVTYLRVQGAGHVAAWNHAPDRYEAALERFLAALG